MVGLSHAYAGEGDVSLRRTRARRLTGLAKWLRLAPALLRARKHPFPLAFAFQFLRDLCWEKLTILDGRTYIKGNYPTLESRAWNVAVESLSRISRGEQRLLTICISPTMRCPMNCFYCSGRNYPPQQELSTSRLRELVREAQDLGVFAVDFSGGEPLLRDDLPEIISAVDDRSLSLLFTSGFRFPRMSRALRLAGLEHVVISLDTFDESEYNRRRGHPKAFAFAVEAIEALLHEGFYTMLEMTMPESSLAQPFQGAVEINLAFYSRPEEPLCVLVHEIYVAALESA